MPEKAGVDEAAHDSSGPRGATSPPDVAQVGGRTAGVSAGRSVLTLLLAADLLCIVLFVYNVNFAPTREWWMNLSNDHGWAEFYIHLKQLWAVMLLLALWRVAREPVLVGWLAVAVFYGVDDVLHLHEDVAKYLTEVGPTLPLVGSQANHVWELGWLAAWGVVLGTFLLVVHRRSGPVARRFSRHLAVVFAFLLVAGIVLDVLHTLVSDIQYVNGLFIIFEEGGEHVVMSVLVSVLLARLVLLRPQAERGAFLLPADEDGRLDRRA